MKIGEQVTYLAQLKGLSKAETKKRIKFWFERFEMQDWWNKKVEELSKGMQQKVQFISTVIHRPRLLILDEPFTGFDPINTNKIKDEILRFREEGATIIFSTHRMESVEELCDDIALINKSKLVLQGKKADIKKANKTNLYRVDFEGNLNGLPNEIQEREDNDTGLNSVMIKLRDGEEANQLLSVLINKITVHNFVEQIPTINDIFIKTVNESNHG
jgi:ABC-2 type transport system ATP-binding protein